MSINDSPIRLLEMQARLISRFSLDSFREVVDELRPTSIFLYLTRVHDDGFRSKLLRAADTQKLYQALLLMGPDLKCRCLMEMGETQRLQVKAHMSAEEQSATLRLLESWQERESRSWPACILPRLVMTRARELPEQYPEGMKTCHACESQYGEWLSVIAADCYIHSICSRCDVPDNCCSVCNL